MKKETHLVQQDQEINKKGTQSDVLPACFALLQFFLIFGGHVLLERFADLDLNAHLNAQKYLPSLSRFRLDFYINLEKVDKNNWFGMQILFYNTIKSKISKQNKTKSTYQWYLFLNFLPFVLSFAGFFLMRLFVVLFFLQHLNSTLSHLPMAIFQSL